MADENMTPETEVKAPTPAVGEDLMPRSEAENLLKALKSEREARKQYERALEGTNGTDDRAKEILYNLGTIAENEGNPEEARSFFIRIYEVDIGYRDVADKMGTAE